MDLYQIKNLSPDYIKYLLEINNIEISEHRSNNIFETMIIFYKSGQLDDKTKTELLDFFEKIGPHNGYQVDTLGQGSYGTVYKYKTLEGISYAVKKMEYDEYEGIDSAIINDIAALKTLDHPNIVKIVDVKIDRHSSSVNMVMNLANNDLSGFIQNNEYKLNDIPGLIYPLFEAMGYYLNKNILHLDIKPTNILVFDNNLFKFTDFGLSKQGYCNVYPGSKSTNVVTMLYRSPDILLGYGRYDSMADIWQWDVFCMK